MMRLLFDFVEDFVRTNGIVLLVGGLLWLAFNGLLLVGIIDQRRPKMMISWLLMVSIGLGNMFITFRYKHVTFTITF